MQFADDISLEGTVQANCQQHLPHPYYHISVRTDIRGSFVHLKLWKSEGEGPRLWKTKNCARSHDRHVPWGVACGGDTVRARSRGWRGDEATDAPVAGREAARVACTPASSRRALYVPSPLEMHPFVRSPGAKIAVRVVLPHLHLLTVYSVRRANNARKVSVLELRFLVEAQERRKFTQILPQTVQFRTVQNFKKKKERRRYEREFCFHLFHTSFGFFCPLQISKYKMYNLVRSLKRTQMYTPAQAKVTSLSNNPRKRIECANATCHPACRLLPSSCCRVETMGISIRSE